MPKFALSSSFYGQEKLEERFFREAVENGFKAVELLIKPGHFRGIREEEVYLMKKISADYGIKVESVHCDFEILDPPTIEVFKKAKDVILNNLDLVAELGGRFLVIHNYIFANPKDIIVDEDGILHPGLSLLRDLEDKNSGALERIKDGMSFYSREAKKRGVSIALETESVGNDQLLDFISEADPRGCGICFDTGHAQIASDAVKTAKLLAPRVVCTHLHDNDGEKDLHRPPFKGIIDWKNLLMELVRGGYQGTYTFECGGGMSDIVEARKKFEEVLNHEGAVL